MLPFLDPATEMKEGMNTPAIKAAEEMLEAVGYDPGEVDGSFDEQTAQAVKKIQEDLTLEATGILAGETTIGLMNKLRTKIQEDDPQLLKAKELLIEKLGQ
jgi:carboxyl-terminal processing protease